MSKRVPVIFRRDRDKDGSVFALFPTLPADVEGKYCTCHQHVGQHGSADYTGCIARSRPAKPSEFRELAAELRSRGYRYKIYNRQTVAMRAEFDKRRKKWCGI